MQVRMRRKLVVGRNGHGCAEEWFSAISDCPGWLLAVVASDFIRTSPAGLGLACFWFASLGQGDIGRSGWQDGVEVTYQRLARSFVDLTDLRKTINHAAWMHTVDKQSSG